MAANVIRIQPGSTRMAITHVQDIMSSFELFIPDTIPNISLHCTNLEGRCVFGERWAKLIYMHTLGFLSLQVFSDPMGNLQNPCGMQKLADNFSMLQCLWKTSTLFSGLSGKITETPDQLGGRETS